MEKQADQTKVYFKKLLYILGAVAIIALTISAFLPEEKTVSEEKRSQWHHTIRTEVLAVDTFEYGVQRINIYNVGGEKYNFSYGQGNARWGNDFTVTKGVVYNYFDDGLTVQITTYAEFTATIEGVQRTVILAPQGNRLVGVPCGAAVKIGIENLDLDEYCDERFVSEAVYQQFVDQAVRNAESYGLHLYTITATHLNNPDLNKVTNPMTLTIEELWYE